MLIRRSASSELIGTIGRADRARINASMHTSYGRSRDKIDVSIVPVLLQVRTLRLSGSGVQKSRHNDECPMLLAFVHVR